MQVAVRVGVWCVGCWALGGAAVSAFGGCWVWLAVSVQPVFRWQVAWCLESGARGITLQEGNLCLWLGLAAELRLVVAGCGEGWGVANEMCSTLPSTRLW